MIEEGASGQVSSYHLPSPYSDQNDLNDILRTSLAQVPSFRPSIYSDQHSSRNDASMARAPAYERINPKRSCAGSDDQLLTSRDSDGAALYHRDV